MYPSGYAPRNLQFWVCSNRLSARNLGRKMSCKLLIRIKPRTHYVGIGPARRDALPPSAKLKRSRALRCWRTSFLTVERPDGFPIHLFGWSG